MDLNAIPDAVWPTAGAAGMFVALFWMLAKDHLVTGPAHRRELGYKDEMIALKNEAIAEHKSAGATKDKTIESLTASVAKLTIAGDTAAHSLSDVARLAAATARPDCDDPETGGTR